VLLLLLLLLPRVGEAERAAQEVLLLAAVCTGETDRGGV
jgi:hypothetical protein